MQAFLRNFHIYCLFGGASEVFALIMFHTFIADAIKEEERTPFVRPSFASGSNVDHLSMLADDLSRQLWQESVLINEDGTASPGGGFCDNTEEMDPKGDVINADSSEIRGGEKTDNGNAAQRMGSKEKSRDCNKERERSETAGYVGETSCCRDTDPDQALSTDTVHPYQSGLSVQSFSEADDHMENERVEQDRTKMSALYSVIIGPPTPSLPGDVDCFPSIPTSSYQCHGAAFTPHRGSRSDTSLGCMASQSDRSWSPLYQAHSRQSAASTRSTSVKNGDNINVQAHGLFWEDIV